MVAVFYTSRSTNPKTGDIPQQYIGADKAEVNASCSGCPLFKQAKPDKKARNKKAQQFGLGCYAHHGGPAWAQASIWRAAAKGKDYSLGGALEKATRSARYVRLAVIGDPSAIDDTQLQADEATIRDAGLGVLSYTHFWNSRGAHLKGRAMASCDTWEQVEDAVALGWRTAIHVDSLEQLQGKTAEGTTYTLCPNQRPNARQCNECGLCDASKQAVDCVVFLEH